VKVHAPLLVDLVGATRAARLESRLGEAADAFAGERFGEARGLLAPIAREVPDLPEARELYGLTLYRLGRWKDAARELDAFVELSGGSTEQHPVLADCRRALQQYKEVDRLWEELREASPSGQLMTEGRIVAAGALADQGDLAAAVRLLAKGFKFPKRPREHHLRRAYALADLYERSGDLPQARSLFGQIARAEPDFLDAAMRADALT
jgi:tetratricopeptide (TPR) repeat protein